MNALSQIGMVAKDGPICKLPSKLAAQFLDKSIPQEAGTSFTSISIKTEISG